MYKSSKKSPGQPIAIILSLLLSAITSLGISHNSYADNIDLDNEAGFDTASTIDDILDFTERNPFGDPDGGGF